MSIGRTQLSDEYSDIKRYEVFTTDKYKLPLYSFSMHDNNGKKVVIKYYILSQDLSKIIKGYNNNPIKAYNVKQNSTINTGFLDYILYNNEAYISSTLISKSKDLVGWNIDMEDLIRDIQNATIAEEMNYAEAIRDFAEYEVECHHSMLVNEDKVKVAMKQAYPFLDESYIEGIVKLVLDNAIINFDLPYNKLEFINEAKMKAVNEAFDFIEEVVRDYRKEFNENNSTTPKEEIKKIENKIAEERSDELTAEFEAAIAKHEETKKIFDASKLHVFVNNMETALIGEIRNVRDDFPAGWIRERFPQEACALQYCDANGNHLLIKDAQKANQSNPGTYNLGDELLAMFFMKHIGNKDATYEHKDANNHRSYYPFLQGKANPEGAPSYYGLLKREKYNNILKQNTTILFPGAKPEEITREHFTIVRNYCEGKL